MNSFALLWCVALALPSELSQVKPQVLPLFPFRFSPPSLWGQVIEQLRDAKLPPGINPGALGSQRPVNPESRAHCSRSCAKCCLSVWQLSCQQPVPALPNKAMPQP